MRFDAVLVATVAFVLPVLASQAPLLNQVDLSESLRDRYIVKLKPGVNISSVCEETKTQTVHTYKVINGFSVKLDKNELDILRNHAGVEYVAEDALVRATAIETQHDAPWGLSRLSTLERLADQNPNNVNFTFSYDSSAGDGVDIYVLDTGVYLEHEEFGGRARWGATFVPSSSDTDVNGHGTHCAGTAAGSRFGVAKRATIIAVKVLNDQGFGTTSSVLAGMDWVWTSVIFGTGRPAIASMSLSVDVPFAPIDDTVAAMAASGIHVITSAGNEGVVTMDSPARASSAITVGATDITDDRQFNSNFGCVVDIHAPGENVISSWVGCTDAYRALSGTSMATAHVAGVIASLISSEGNLFPPDMKARLQQMAIEGAISSIPVGTSNLLLQNGLAPQ